MRHKGTSLNGTSNGRKNSMAERRTTRSASTILSVWSSVTIQYWRVKTSAEIFEVGAAGTFRTSWEQHADTAESRREDDCRVDNFIPRAVQTCVTIISLVWEFYFTKAPAILSCPDKSDDKQLHPFGRQLFTITTLLQMMDSTIEIN